MQQIDPKGSFLKNLVLSLVLLGVSSLLIPLVLKQIDDRKAGDQQRLQDTLARQDTVLAAQAALLDTMAADFWSYAHYASDVVVSRDASFGEAAWRQRATDAYYADSGQLLGTMRAEISTLLRLAPQPTYDAFRRLFEEEILPLDACLLELMKQELEQATPAAGKGPEPIRCSAAAGGYAGSSWDDLAAGVVRQDLGERIDQAFAELAEAFRLQGAPGG